MGWIAIADLGHDPEGLPQAMIDRLRSADRVLVPNARGVGAAVLEMAGVRSEPFSEHGMAVDAPADQIVSTLGELAQSGSVVLGVAGYPFVREGLVMGLLTRVGPVQILPASSPLEVLLLAFDVDMTADLDLVDASALRDAVPERGSHLIVTNIPNAIVAGTVARRLSGVYPPGHPAAIASARPDGVFEVQLVPLDRLAEASRAWGRCAVYVSPHLIAPPGGFPELVRIMSILRAADGCPWDLEQTHETLRPHLIEEAYEAVAAIDAGDMEGLADELGDILLQVVFHAQIAAERGDFTIDDVVANIVTKLRRRHPHIFADGVAATPDEVMHRWDRIKREEKPASGVLDGIAPTLPALAHAQKMSRRAVSVGFEWETVDDVWEKVHEEIDELRATGPGTPEAADEVGDVLFTLVNVARKMGVDAEIALRDACGKFRTRFQTMERLAEGQGRDLGRMSIDDMEALWRLAKSAERDEPADRASDEGSKGT